ncbi:MAG: mRNA cleavage and polyadenylation factor subunit [Claussenomyces sp. TS43310]|nr:MAG: mRNA cleavage and polyadenylation factor subunit [Claussenomyces sp. TS43310]
MQCYTELTPPTAVTHSLSLPFLSSQSRNLVVAKTSLLQIFSLKTVCEHVDSSATNAEHSTKESDMYDPRVSNGDDAFESSFLAADTALLRAEHARTTKLILVAEYPLSGTVISMVRVKTLEAKSGGEVILLAFKDAKLSLVEWDPHRHGLSTISIHYFEQEDLGGSPWAPKLGDCVNYLAVDPASRCAALKFGVRNLAILPFRQSDDDTAMDDWDEELDGPRPAGRTSSAAVNGTSKHGTTNSPYSSSFVLRFSSLDPSLVHPIHLAFLYEYREPTFGILSSAVGPSSSLLRERKDRVSYMAFTLDLDQRASTTILAVTGLPYDLFSVVALSPPVGGVLLVGCNELIHIDQSGKAIGVAVNSFAKQCTAFGLADQANLEIRLEDCTVQQLEDTADMLVILNNGKLCILSFRMDGRSVSGLGLRLVGEDVGGSILPTRASTVTSLSASSIFVGSEEADSVVLGWTKKSKQMNRRQSQTETRAADEVDDYNMIGDMEDDDDDLYGEAPSRLELPGTALKLDSSNSKPGDYFFRVHHELPNIAPLRDIAFSKPYELSTRDQSVAEVLTGDLQLIAASGRDRSGALVVIKRMVEPSVVGRFEFPEAQGVWTLTARKPVAKAIQPDKSTATVNGDEELGVQFDRLMIVSQTTENSTEESAVYALTSAGFEALTGTEFEPAAGATIEAGTLGKGMRIIQVLKAEVRSYDGDLGLAQILPMFDEETGAEPKIVSASIADPFLLLVRDDASIFVVRCDDDSELEEITREDDILLATKWLSACLYTDTTGVFTGIQSDKGYRDGENVFMFLLSAGGALYIYALPDLTKPVYKAEGICFIPSTIAPEYVSRRSAARETLTEIVVADLGDSISKHPYLILRAASDDLTIYEPFRVPSDDTAVPMSKTLHFQKVNNPYLAKNPEVSAGETTDTGKGEYDSPMRIVADIAGLSTVFLPGSSPSFIFKSSTTAPKLLGLRGAGVRGLSGFHTEGCDRGFIYVDMNGIARVSQLPSETNLTELGMPFRRIKIGEDVNAIAYHAPMDCYVFTTSRIEEFELPKDDDYHREWQKEDILLKPLIERGCVKMISPINWSIIDTIELEPCEVALCTKTLLLEVSEETHERKPLITIGTAITRGEDLAVRGCVRVYDIVTVVPEPGRPETSKKLKLIAKEEIPRGAITAISEIGTQGFMLVAQGQKCMVRGLKEDGSLLPVAFMDMNTYVTSVKELPGTGLCILADALKGIWLAGYLEEPYKMILLGKQTQNMEVVTADVLPHGKELYIVVADAECNIHILQYDPEHPKSLQGHLLLHRTTFALGGHLPLTMNLLPRTKATTVLPASSEAMDIAAEETIPEYEILMTLTTGALALLSPLPEAQYRRLNTITNHLSNSLYRACGLNPKAYRVNPRAPEAVIGGRPIVDGTILMRWMELGSQKRSEIARGMGIDVEQVRDDLEALRSGVAYL